MEKFLLRKKFNLFEIGEIFENSKSNFFQEGNLEFLKSFNFFPEGFFPWDFYRGK